MKQLTVKFVQDTSKFWYKPEISRDQGKSQSTERDFTPSGRLTNECLSSLSHFGAEGQGARVLHRAGQSFLQGGLWAGNEGGDPPALSSPTNQERYANVVMGVLLYYRY